MSESKPAAHEALARIAPYSTLVRSARVAANWMADGRFWFVEGAPDKTVIQVFDPRTGAIAPLLDIARTRDALERLLERPLPYQGLPFDSVALDGAGGATFAFEGRSFRLDLQSYVITLIEAPSGVDEWLGTSARARLQPKTYVRGRYLGDGGGAPEMLSPDGRLFLSVKDHNLCLRATVDGRIELLTRDGIDGCYWDVEVLPGRKTSPWSPDSLKIFASKLDDRMVAPVSRTQILGHRDQVEWLRVARAGDALPTCEPYVVDILNRQPVRLDVVVEDRFFVFVGWHSRGEEVYFAGFSRDLREAALYRGDPVTGAVSAILTETGKTFLRIQHEIIFGNAGCIILPDDQGFLWESERDGWKHFYHYGLDGSLIRQLTSGAWPARGLQGIDRKAGLVYFTAHYDPARPYDVHLCRVPLAGGAIERLTEDAGVHEIQMAPDFSAFVATVSRPDRAPVSEVRDAGGRLVHRFAPTTTTKLEAAGWSAPEEFCIKAADGQTDLWGVLYKPYRFDPAKRYPVLQYIYAGPHAASVQHGFATEGDEMAALLQMQAQLGYAVVTLDARGTPGRSKAFHDAVSGDWRRHVTADHAAALRSLAQDRAWLDLDRVGVWGHSWGGYYALATLIDHPELYKACVASAPGIDPYSLFLIEPYLGGVPGPETKAAYDDADVIRDAPCVEGALMMAAGTSDVATWRDALKMSHALIEAGKHHEFVVLPAQYHVYGSVAWRYFLEKFVDFFERHVKGG